MVQMQTPWRSVLFYIILILTVAFYEDSGTVCMSFNFNINAWYKIYVQNYVDSLKDLKSRYKVESCTALYCTTLLYCLWFRFQTSFRMKITQSVNLLLHYFCVWFCVFVRSQCYFSSNAGFKRNSCVNNITTTIPKWCTNNYFG